MPGEIYSLTREVDPEYEPLTEAQAENEVVDGGERDSFGGTHSAFDELF